jgi:hypothetical protein
VLLAEIQKPGRRAQAEGFFNQLKKFSVHRNSAFTAETPRTQRVLGRRVERRRVVV